MVVIKIRHISFLHKLLPSLCKIKHQTFLKPRDWDIIGLSRCGGISASPNIKYISVDLLNKENILQQLGTLSAVTHIFYAAYQDKPTWAELVEPNLIMLVNVVEAMEPIALNLQHISLMQGYKVYGAHSKKVIP